MGRVRGIRKLIHDAIDETSKLVQATHRSVSRKRMRFIGRLLGAGQATEGVERVERFAASGIYNAIRAINRGVEIATDIAMTSAAGMSAERDAPASRAGRMRTVLNGIIGDYLHRRMNDLAIEMSVRVDEDVVPIEAAALKRAFPHASPTIAVFVHGLCYDERSWNLYAEEYYGDPRVNIGTQLERDLGYTPIFIRYNTGRHISDNGKELSDMLERIFENFPVPIEEIMLVGHSMGGLVVRSASHYGDCHGKAWVNALTRVFCIASPHLGAPLEKAANLLTSLMNCIDTPGTQVPAAIINARSVGIKDLRFGYIVEEEWADRDPDAVLDEHRRDVALLDGVCYCFLASTITRDPQHPAAGLLGDMLVRLPSAVGQHPEAARRIPFHFGRVFPRMNHLHIINHPDVYEQIRSLCE